LAPAFARLAPASGLAIFDTSCWCPQNRHVGSCMVNYRSKPGTFAIGLMAWATRRNWADAAWLALMVKSGGAGVLDDQLRRDCSVPDVLLQAVCDVHVLGQEFRMVETDCIKALMAAFQAKFQMFVLEQALMLHSENVAKDGCWKPGSPNLF